MRTTAVFLLTLLPLLACDSGGGPGGTEPPPGQTGTLAGQVSDGAGVAAVQVSVSRAGQTTRNATTGADGRFTLANLAAGVWQVGVTIPGTHEADPSQPLPAPVTVVANQTANVTLLLRRKAAAGTIGGRVREGASGVAGVSLELTGPGVTRQTVTGPDGAYGFADVIAGGYTVALTLPSGFQLAAGEVSSKLVALVGGQAATVDFNIFQPDNGQLQLINLANFNFTPQNVTITAGTRVRWTNPTDMAHTVTPNGHTEWLDTGLQPGATFEHVFNSPGTYNYYCSPHRLDGMTGVITVQ